jgi:ATP-binding cassette subfamily B protein
MTVTRRTVAAARRMSVAVGLTAKASPGALTAYVVLVLLAGAGPVAIALLTRLVLDGLVGGAPAGTLAGLGVGLAAVGLVTGVTPQFQQYLKNQLDRAVGVLAQDRLFTAVDGFVGLGRFEDPRFLDRLRLAQQAGGTTVSRAVDGALGIIRAAITISGFLGSLFLISPLMATLVLGSGIPTFIAQIALSRRRAQMLWNIGPIERREFFYSQLLSTVEAAQEVRLFGIGAFLRGRMLADRRNANIAKRAMDRRETRIQATLGLLAATVSGGGLLWALDTARGGTLSVGGITMFVAAVTGVQGALAILATELAQAHQTLLLLDHYLAVTTSGPDLPIAAAASTPGGLRRGIELRDVWFRYSDKHSWALRGVDLVIPRGQSVALVGLNGAGKSTIVKLLCRFYDPDRGAILWDGVDLRDIDPAALRQRIGAVFQDYMDYDMTAAENIGLGDLQALHDRPRIHRAAGRAGIHDRLAELPHGYDTLLSRTFFAESDRDNPETGVILSGGQCQRLALARAFLRDRRDLMILDEPSAGLDAESEHDIHASLRQHRAGRTSLLISHRLGAVRGADLIVVLTNGRVVEQGDHAALMAEHGEYCRLFTLQADSYQDAVNP